MSDSAILDDEYLLLLLIVDRNRNAKIVQSLNGQGIYSPFAMLGSGTATSDILDLLGLGATKKDILLCVLRAPQAPDILMQLAADCRLDKPGTGIAFTLPTTAALYRRGLMHQGNFTEERDDKMQAHRHNLILAVTNNGFSDLVMTAIRSVHPSGGTIVRGRETGLRGGETFFGVAIQPEKELLLVVVPGEHTEKILDAIMEKAGPHSKADTFAVTLPVLHAVGLYEEQKK